MWDCSAIWVTEMQTHNFSARVKCSPNPGRDPQRLPGPYSVSRVSSCCTPNLLLPRPIYQPQNMLNAAQIFGIVYCKSSSQSQSLSQLTSTSTLASQLNVLSTPAAKLEISIHAPQCHFRECASSWQNFFFFIFIFPPPRSLCMQQQREEIDMRATRNCQQYG